MRSGFIRALWGSGDAGLWEPALADRAVCKTWQDVRNCWRAQRHLRAVTYVYGRENFDFARSLGYAVELVDERPVVFQGRGGMWRHKLEILSRALLDFDEVIYLDHDVRKSVRRVPRDLWRRLRRRGPLQAALRQYRRPQCPWRAVARGLLPAGAFIYLRDGAIARRLLEVSSAQPHWSDELCMAYVFDELDPNLWLQGAASGVLRFAQRFDPYCYHVRGMVTACTTPLFVTGRIPGS